MVHGFRDVAVCVEFFKDMAICFKDMAVCVGFKDIAVCVEFCQGYVGL